MAGASTSGNMSPELLKVVERAQREPEGRFHSLAHLIDVGKDRAPSTFLASRSTGGGRRQVDAGCGARPAVCACDGR